METFDTFEGKPTGDWVLYDDIKHLIPAEAPHSVEEPLIKWDALFGHINLESRMRREGDRLIGEGRAMHYNGKGDLVLDSGWEPTGVVCILNGYEPTLSRTEDK